LKSPPAALADLFDVRVTDNFPPRYNIAPTQPIALIRQSERRKREYALARWGFIPEWARQDYHDRMGSRPLINARAETVAEKPSFRSAFKRRRCLIPADGYYEWRVENGARQPYCIQHTDETLFAFGGIWETATDPDGGEIDTVAILTTAAGEQTKALHLREPVRIAPEHFALWLEADERDIAMLAPLLNAAPARTWRYFAVSKDLNSPRNDGPALIEPQLA